MDFTHIKTLHGKVSCQKWFKETSSTTNLYKPDSVVEADRFLESRYPVGAQAILLLYNAQVFYSESFSSVERDVLNYKLTEKYQYS